MFHFLVILLLGHSPEAAAMQSYEDSVIVYNAYKDNIKTLKETSDMHKWYRLEDTLSVRTACSLRRLRLYNHAEYKPVIIYEKKGMGIAPFYPAPSGTSYNTPNSNVNAATLSLYRATAYSVIGQETRFIVNEKGRSIIPYVERVYFDVNHNLIKIVKLNPITFLPLVPRKQDEMVSLN